MARSFVIFASESHGWRMGLATETDTQLLDISSSADASPQDLAAAVAAALSAQEYDGRGILLAIPSAWCLCANVQASGLRRANRDSALLYRLEEQLPLAAEEFVADFCGDEERLLGVCCRLDRLSPLVDALEAQGIAIECLCPLPLFALQTLNNSASKAKISPFDVVLWENQEHFDLLVLSGHRLTQWTWLPADPARLILQLDHLLLDRSSPLRIGIASAPPLVLEALGNRPDMKVRMVDLPSQELAALASADRLINRGYPSLINLRRGQLAPGDALRQIRSPVSALTYAAAAFLLALAVALLVRSHQYQQLTNHYIEQEITLFHQALPQQAVPLNPHARLASEAKRLHGLSGESSPLLAQKSALDRLRDALLGLPRDLRFRLVELRLQNDQLYVEGQARSHSEAEMVADALRQSLSMSVDPPRTEQEPQPPGSTAEPIVEFTITGQRSTNQNGTMTNATNLAGSTP